MLKFDEALLMQYCQGENGGKEGGPLPNAMAYVIVGGENGIAFSRDDAAFARTKVVALLNRVGTQSEDDHEGNTTSRSGGDGASTVVEEEFFVGLLVARFAPDSSCLRCIQWTDFGSP